MGTFVTQEETPTVWTDKVAAPGQSRRPGWEDKHLALAADFATIKGALLDVRVALRTGLPEAGVDALVEQLADEDIRRTFHGAIEIAEGETGQLVSLAALGVSGVETADDYGVQVTVRTKTGTPLNADTFNVRVELQDTGNFYIALGAAPGSGVTVVAFTSVYLLASP